MTTPRYPQGCTAGSQAPGDASADDSESNAWNLNLNNGNANVNNQSNQGLALAVCGPVPSVGECQGAATFRQLFDAWKRARKQKCSHNQLLFESRLTDNLLDLEERLNTHAWGPGETLCFIAAAPKAREIHAPDFADRVVHHWLVPRLEVYWEPTFIGDCYANRKGKGLHAAVERVGGFMRQVESGEGDGWILPLDISNYFNRIRRQVLLTRIERRLQRLHAPEILIRTTRALLRGDPLAGGVRTRASPGELALVPPHKRLANAPPGCGLPIGNLTSQFFANVHLDPLDQFVKHELKARRYARYVDDFVLIHRDRGQLEAWQAAIIRFLRNELQLELKPGAAPRRLRDGVDFLGYVIRPTHVVVRRRVIAHAHERLQAWERRHVAGGAVRATPAEFRQLCSTWSSYAGHFAHADSFRLRQRFHRRYPWLAALTEPQRKFDHRLEGRTLSIPIIGVAAK